MAVIIEIKISNFPLRHSEKIDDRKIVIEVPKGAILKSVTSEYRLTSISTFADIGYVFLFESDDPNKEKEKRTFLNLKEGDEVDGYRFICSIFMPKLDGAYGKEVLHLFELSKE